MALAATQKTKKGSTGMLLETVLVWISSFLAAVFYPRLFILGLMDHRLGRDARRARGEGQRLVEWITYRRYRDILPRPLLIVYFALPVVYPLLLAAGIVFACFEIAIGTYTVFWLALLPTLAALCAGIAVSNPFGSEDCYALLFDRKKGEHIEKPQMRQYALLIAQLAFWVILTVFLYIAMLPAA